MTVTERVAYVRGLFEGLEVNVDKKEGRILKEMIDVLGDMALSITDLEDENEALQEVIDAMIEDIYDDDDSYDEEDVDTDDIDFDPDTELFEVVCPSCGEEIYVDESTLSQGNITCPACGEELEFDMSTLDGDLSFDEIPDDEIPDEDISEDDFPDIEFASDEEAEEDAGDGSDDYLEDD